MTGARGRGRPKGSTNKRPADLAAYLTAKFGGSAALQMAQACMVTPAEVREAGGVLAARIEKARQLQVALGGKTTLREAFEILSRELVALAPYTDKRQPQAIEASGPGLAPSVVLQLGGAGGQAMPTELDFAEVFTLAPAVVSQPKSHAEGEAPEILALSPPDAAD